MRGHVSRRLMAKTTSLRLQKKLISDPRKGKLHRSFIYLF